MVMKGKNPSTKLGARKRIVLLDANAIIHRAYHALPEFTSSQGEPTGALYGLSAMLIRILSDLKPDYIFAAYDLPGKTFRHEAYKEYKAGRIKAPEELIAQLNRSRDIFTAFAIPIYDQPSFEADDILGTMVKKLEKEKDAEVIIASGDMDTFQLINGKKVQVYTLKKGITDVVIYDEKKVLERFGFGPKLLPDYKGLRGDPSDNIIGVKGIGEKTATTLIKNFGTIEEIYKKLKSSPSTLLGAGVSERIIRLLQENEEEALFSKTLAQIRSDAPIDFKLPEKIWPESFSGEKAEKLFHELGFKSLIERLKKTFDFDFSARPGVSGRAEKSAEVLAQRPATAPMELRLQRLENALLRGVSEQEIKETGIALWLIDSEKTNPDLEDILNWAGTQDFKKAKEKILAEIKKNKLENVYNDIELPLIPILKKAEQRGVLIDIDYLKKLSADYHSKLAGLEKKIYKLAGKEFNINSPKQLGEILFDKLHLPIKGLKKTAGGARSTRESELEKLKEAHPIIEKILSHRELNKLLTTYIDALPALVDKDNRLHAHFNQAGTTTGRMSSENPNVQNIPIRGELGMAVRRAFISSPGHKWITCDYSQIEMRVLALFSEDENLISVFKKGEDVHTAVAARVFEIPENKVTADERRMAKTINFGIIYGMGINALKQNLGSTREEAERFYNNFFNQFPKVRSYFDQVKKDAAKKGYTETLFGRRRYFPALKSKVPYLRAAAERMAMNAPLQGTAADIIKIAMREIDKEIKNSNWEGKVHLLLQVHDELIYEAPSEIALEAARLIKRVMENAIESRMPFAANAYMGDNWRDLKIVV